MKLCSPSSDFGRAKRNLEQRAVRPEGGTRCCGLRYGLKPNGSLIAANVQELDVCPMDPVFDEAGSGGHVPPHVNDHASGGSLTCHVEQALSEHEAGPVLVLLDGLA